MNLLLRFTSPNMETAYNQTKSIYSKSFLLLLMTISIGLLIFSAFQSVSPQSIGSILKMSTILVLCGILCKCGCKIEAYKNLILTALSLGLIIHEVFSYRELFIPIQASTFHVGYAFGIFERVIIRQVSRVELRIGFLIASAITRLILIPIHSQIIMFYHWVWWVIGLMAEVLRERDDRAMFKEFYDSKEELIKFKNLMVSSLPTNILILTKDLKRKLFMNEYFQTTFHSPKEETSLADWSVSDWLSRFFIEKEKLNGSTKDVLAEDMESELNMLQILQKLIEKRLLDDHSHQFCFQMRNKSTDNNDAKRIFETQVFLLPWDGKSAVAVILNNVTQQYMNLALRVADTNKDRMIAMVSHELRTPLNCILGMISIMEKQIKDSQILTYLTVCKNSGTLLLNLVNSILDLGQIRNNKFKLTVSKGNIHDILEEIYLLFEIQFKAKNLYLKIDVMSDVDQTIVSDLNRLKQIIINLIANALKFTSEGGVSVFVSTHKSLEGYLTFKVSDTGIGIKEEDKKKLFKMYGRLDHTDPKLNSEGVGLGLTISDYLVRLLSGSEESTGIQVESEYGKGTTFSFSIKSHLKSSAPAEYDLCYTEGREHSYSSEDSKEFASKISNYIIHSNNYSLLSPLENKRMVRHSLQRNHSFRIRLSDSSSHSPQPEYSGEVVSPKSPISLQGVHEDAKLLGKNISKGNVLLVDDSPFNIMVAKHIIENLGYHVETALNGKEAVDIVKRFSVVKKSFKIIFMDCQMPIMNGYEATKVLRKMMLTGEIMNVPIVALSANDTEGDKQMCREVGMCEHLAKPLNERKLIETVEKFCRRATYGHMVSNQL